MIEIRDATPDDAPAMARVIVDTWFAAHKGQVSEARYQQRRDTWGYAESERGWRRSIGEADGESARVLVAADQGRIIAVAASEVIGKDHAEVGALYVDSSHQRAGIGRRLLHATIDHYRRLRIPTLHIAVLAANRPARDFYEALGGRESGTREEPDGVEVVYAWNLSGSSQSPD